MMRHVGAIKLLCGCSRTVGQLSAASGQRSEVSESSNNCPCDCQYDWVLSTYIMTLRNNAVLSRLLCVVPVL